MKDLPTAFLTSILYRLFVLSLGFLASSPAVHAQAGKVPGAQPTPAAPAAATTPAASAKTTPGVVGDRNATVEDRVPPEQILSLQAGNDTFSARYIGDLSGQPLGAVIVLHASGQHPSWPFTVAALLDDLPLHGWSTLSIELPAPAQDPAAPAATAANSPGAAAAPINAAANKPNTAAAAAATAAAGTAAPGIEPQAQARIGAAVKYFADQKQSKVVLLGFGSGATRAAEWARQLVANQPPPPKTEPISALILIAPLNRLNGLEQDLPKILPSTELPALDIILSSDPQALADAEARRRAVLHQRERIYRRLELPPIAAAESAQHSLMVRRVRAWLQRQATGEPAEVDTSRSD